MCTGYLHARIVGQTHSMQLLAATQPPSLENKLAKQWSVFSNTDYCWMRNKLCVTMIPCLHVIYDELWCELADGKMNMVIIFIIGTWWHAIIEAHWYLAHF